MQCRSLYPSRFCCALPVISGNLAHICDIACAIPLIFGIYTCSGAKQLRPSLVGPRRTYIENVIDRFEFIAVAMANWVGREDVMP